MKIAPFLLFAGLASNFTYGLLAYGQNAVVVVPMFDSETVFTGVGKTGDTKCSEYKNPPGNWQEVSCNSIPVSLRGQDGDLKQGAEVSPRFTDNSDGTVTDNLTALIWLREAYCVGEMLGSSWSDALGFIVELNTSGTMNGNDCSDTSLAGAHETDWRLPNVRELQTILDYGSYASPYLLSGHPFLNVRTNKAYWSSTNYGLEWDQDLNVNLLDDALRVSFKDAVVDGTSKAGLQHVWAVRSEN